MMQYLAERFLYLPLIGWVIAFAVFASRVPRQSLAHFTVGAVILLWAVTGWNRSFIWQDPVTLFVRSSQEGPKTARVQQNAVGAIFALPHMRNVFEQRPGNVVYIHPVPAQDRPAVLRTLQEGRRLFPANLALINALANIYSQAGEYQEMVKMFEEAVSMHPKSGTLWNNLAQAALDARMLEKAKVALTKAEQLSAEDPRTLNLLARYYGVIADHKSQLDALRRLNSVAPSDDTARLIQETESKLKPAKN